MQPYACVKTYACVGESFTFIQASNQTGYQDINANSQNILVLICYRPFLLEQQYHLLELPIIIPLQFRRSDMQRQKA